MTTRSDPLARRGRGRPPHPDLLTPAEWEVVERVRHGLTNRQIARARGTSLDATKFHVANVLSKLGLRDREALRRWRGRAADSAACDEGGTGMTNMKLGALGQVSMPVTDIGEAERFYGEVLGLPHLYTFGNLAFFDCGGTRLFLSAEGEGFEHHGSVLYFRVPQIDAAYDALRARGVEFQGAPHLIHTHEDGTEEWMAFFQDPFGNTLAVMAVASNRGAAPP